MLAAAGGVLACFGGAAPTGLTLIDLLYTAAAGAALAFAGGRSRRAPWLVSVAISLWVTPTTVGRVVALLALALAVLAVARGRRRIIGAAIGALLAFVLGDLGGGPFHGATLLFAALAAAPMLISGALLMPAAWRRPLALAASTAAAAAALATLVFGLAGLLAVGDVGDGVDHANRGFDEASDGEQAAAALSFDLSAGAFERARSKVSGFWTLPARLVPVVGQHVRAIQVTAGEGVALTEAAGDTARSADPDDIRLVEGRVDLGLLQDLQPVLDRAERALDRAHERVGDSRSSWLVPPIADRMERLLDELDRARPSARTAALAVDHVPEMLGADGPTSWLVALTTPAEARGLGGLLGNWVLVEADDGAIEIVLRGRNEDVNTRLRERDVPLTGPEQYVDRWAIFEPNAFFQDVTLSPDLPMVAEVAADLFEAAFDRSVDGVIVIDPYALQAVLELSGPIEAGDARLTAERLVPFLLTDQYVDYADDELGRILVLNDLVEAAFDRFTSGSLPGPRAVATEFGPVIDEDRVGVWWRDGGGPADLIDATGLDGAWPDHGGGDLVALVHQNAGQNKLDTYLQRELDYALTIDDGQADATITVTLRNTVDDLTLPDAIVASNDQGFPRGTNVVRLGVHSALPVSAVTVDGVETPFNRQPAFGAEVATVVVEVPPGGSRTVVLEAAGPLLVGPAGYRLTLPAQPLVNPDLVDLAVVVDGNPVELPTGFTLRTDRVLSVDR